MALSWPLLLNALLRGEDLNPEHTAWAMGEIMSGDATPAQVAGFLMAMRAKGETPAEVAGLVKVMLANATPIDVTSDATDIVGTGGDGAHTVNISTMAALVIAGAGVPVVKHGNRAASSKCGAADLLEELGVRIDIEPDVVARCVTEAGIGFCFSAKFHPGMRHAAVPRRELGVPTVFNLLGPLTNPAQPRAAAVGCAYPQMASVIAGVFAERGTSALVMRGEDGLDEFTTAAPTRIWLVRDGQVHESVLDAADLGIARSADGDLRGADAPYNAKVAREMLAGERGPVRDAVLINAAAGIAAFDGFGPGDTSEVVLAGLRSGLERAAASVDSGAAADVLDRWITVAA